MLIRWYLASEPCWVHFTLFVCFIWRQFFIGSLVGQQDQDRLSLWALTKIEVISKFYCVHALLQVEVTPQAPIVSELI